MDRRQKLISSSTGGTGFAIPPDYGQDQPNKSEEHDGGYGETKATSYIGSYVSEQDVDDYVPNYRIAVESSPRKCATCRFFQPRQSHSGDCSAFDVEVGAEYVCDAWQAKDLTPHHTPVRNAQRGKSDDVSYENNIVDGDTQREWQEYPVIGMQNRTQELEDLPVWREESVNYTNADNANDYRYPDEVPLSLRAVQKHFIIGDHVFSSALRSLGVIQNIHDYSGNKVYSLKLIDHRGITVGYAVTGETDLTMKSNRALKTKIKSEIEEETNQDVLQAAVEDTIAITRKVYKALEAVYNTHKDGKLPLRNDEVLTPLQNDILSVLEEPVLKNVKTGKRRKYLRAIQEAASSIGSARQVLFDAYRQISDDTHKGTNNKNAIIAVAQKAALQRVYKAFEVVKNSLILPSATHGDAGAGIE